MGTQLRIARPPEKERSQEVKDMEVFREDTGYDVLDLLVILQTAQEAINEFGSIDNARRILEEMQKS